MPDAATTHVYFEWQCATLMYAYDVISPLPRTDDDAIAARKQKVEQEVYQIFLNAVPADIRNDPTRSFPAEVVMGMTKATLRRAAEICGA